MHNWTPFSLTYITYPTDGDIYAPILALLSLLPPFGVCALTTATVIYKDVIAAYLLVGILISTVISAMLKRLIQEPRPERYDVEDDIEFGMPSNHSCFAWFCCTFVLMYVAKKEVCWAATKLPSRCCESSTKTEPSTNEIRQWVSLAKLWNFLHTSFTVILSLFTAVFCSYSRIYLGYHSPAQVYVGSILGIGLGAFWYHLFQTKLVRDVIILVDGTVYVLERERRATMHRKRD
jgi:dolichyldiphosphatase